MESKILPGAGLVNALPLTCAPDLARDAMKPNRAALAKSGWTRPVRGTVEMNPVRYSSSLKRRARIRSSELAEIERRLLRFLADDRAESLFFRSMNAGPRSFVQDYCASWRLQSREYDVSPNITAHGIYHGRDDRRYVQCDKTKWTCAPCPLLSEAARESPEVLARMRRGNKNKKKTKAFSAPVSRAEGRILSELAPRMALVNEEGEK